ncbi:MULTISPECIES: hypothetical protein [Staphylococcus]|uniref:Phage protein n=2 Tax=Staphylococcus TaxID=1279 RepID=A0ABX1SV57_STACP|nr:MULTISPECIES: hypothetical protein [Staphylococcus]TQC70423.1 hypothetical protein EKV42_07675 [Staphylococcus sp. SKL71207]DAI71497.1 MAG TPA: tail component [Caudoviricetes sp.]EGS40307.1 hypothetical protein SEVCU116_1781 [Staphylococcus capitis VCU116]MBF2239440.1 hypothetical protein [Staphylococcus capitis]MBF2244380.1 hypothetical protein [Staphylococcus capitis]
MFDMLKTLQKYLLKNATVAQYCTGRIRAYHYDETADTSGPYILITPLAAPQPSTYASDVSLTTEYLYQIDVRGPQYDVVKLIQEEIRKTMWDIGFRQQDGIDEYDHEIKIYMDARRYRGNPYTIDELRHIG